MTTHNEPPKSGWMLCAFGTHFIHRVRPNALWIPYLGTTAHTTACGRVAVPADDEVINTHPRCPDCTYPRPATVSSWFEAS